MYNFTEEQIKRYSRHIILPEVGGLGQTKLLEAKVLLVGAGGLGSPAAFYLAAAGVGTLGIIDADVVDLSNLQRQILHRSADVGRPKTESAKGTLRALNPDVEVRTYPELPGGRRAGGAARHHRDDSGDRDAQGDFGHRQAPDRASAAL